MRLASFTPTVSEKLALLSFLKEVKSSLTIIACVAGFFWCVFYFLVRKVRDSTARTEDEKENDGRGGHQLINGDGYHVFPPK